MRKIHWLSSFTDYNKSASIRLRAKLIQLLSVRHNINFSIGHIIPKDTDLIIVGKPGKNNFGLQEEWINKLANFKKKENIILDYVDHLIDEKNSNTQYAGFYKKVLNYCAVITCSSYKLKEKLSTFTKKDIWIIEDPYEFEINSNLQTIKTNNFYWFGAKSNLKFLFALIASWESEKKNNLIIHTDNKGLFECASKINQLQNEKLNLFFDLWSLENMQKVIPDISGIVIPGDPNDRFKSNVSSNRIITSFALGRPVAASYYDSYLEYKEFFVNIDEPALFKKFLNNPLAMNDKVKDAQNLIKKNSSENIIKKWEDLILRKII